MEESTCHEMVIYVSQIYSCMLCLLYFLHVFISFKYDIHNEVKRMKVKREKRKDISALMV